MSERWMEPLTSPSRLPPPPPGPPPPSATKLNPATLCPVTTYPSPASLLAGSSTGNVHPAPKDPAQDVQGKAVPEKEKGKAVAAALCEEKELPGGSLPGGAASAGRRGSYKDALLRPRTFKPRFPASGHVAPQVWLTEDSMGRKKGSPSSVWSRLGPGGSIQARSGGRLQQSYGGSLLETLKAKAGRRCYNCLSAGHFIAPCRDPPRCISCFRFGHKARSCKTPLVPARHLPAVAPVAAATPLPSVAAASLPPSAAALPTATPSAPPVAVVPSAGPAPAVCMDFHRPGAPGYRPDHVRAGVARTDVIRQAKRDLEIFALLAVPLVPPLASAPRHSGRGWPGSCGSAASSLR
jgi:hypothetical protein